MTRVKLIRRDGILCEVEAVGHADDRSVKGEDVVCAAVSSLMMSLALGLSDVAKLRGLKIEREPDVPRMSISWPRESAGQVDLLTKTIALSLKEIESGHAGCLTISEVKL